MPKAPDRFQPIPILLTSLVFFFFQVPRRAFFQMAETHDLAVAPSFPARCGYPAEEEEDEESAFVESLFSPSLSSSSSSSSLLSADPPG